MAFPQSPLGIKVQLNLQGLGWTDIVRNDSLGYRILTEDGITVQRGHTAEQQRTTTSSMDLTLLDPNGVFNNTNPRSPYYGILPRNVPIRFFVQRPLVALYLSADGSGYFATPSSAILNTAGDLDLTIDFDMTRMRQDPGHILCSKWLSTGNQRSWILRVDSSGYVRYNWSALGSDVNQVTSSVPLPPSTTGRIAIRVFHDVVNGANSSVLFQTAPTNGGTFTNLGTQISVTGTTSIFAGSAPVEIGSGNGGIGVFAGISTMIGRIYYFKLLRNAAQSSVVDFTGLTSGATTYTDSNSNLYTLTAATNGLTTEITNADYRFYGEVSSLPQKSDNTSKLVKVPLEAAGVIRRLDANASPLRSTIFKGFSNLNATAYWPCEDSNGALQAGSAVVGSPNATLADLTFTTDVTLPASAGCMVYGSSGPIFQGTAKNSTSNSTTQTNFLFFMKFPSIPLSNVTLFSASLAGGSAARVDFTVTTISYMVTVFDNTGATLVTANIAFGVLPTQWVAFKIKLAPSGSNTNMSFEWYPVGAAVGTNFFVSGTSSYAGSPGRFSKLISQGIAALSGVHVAHLLFTATDVGFSTFQFAAYSGAYAGETAGARWTRILTDAGVSGKVIGNASDTELMGPQPIDTIMNILYECADVDGGEIVEPRNRLGLDYRTRVNMLDQYGLGLNYGTGGTQKQLSNTLTPTPDDLNVANDITLSRRNGANVQVTLDSGPMSTLDPTLGGIGRVQSAPEINNYADSRLLALAQYMLGLSTWPEARYPTIQLALHRISAFAFYDAAFTLAANTDIGDVFGVTNLPIWLPPETLLLIARGQQETFTQFTWDITYNATPGYPYTTNYLSDQTGEQKRADATPGNTVLNAAINTTATTASFKTLSGALCTTTATRPQDFPFDAMIGGERITVTAITGTTSPQAATITRSVNGIVKAQVINAPIQLPNDTAMLLGL